MFVDSPKEKASAHTHLRQLRDIVGNPSTYFRANVITPQILFGLIRINILRINENLEKYGGSMTYGM